MRYNAVWIGNPMRFELSLQNVYSPPKEYPRYDTKLYATVRFKSRSFREWRAAFITITAMFIQTQPDSNFYDAIYG